MPPETNPDQVESELRSLEQLTFIVREGREPKTYAFTNTMLKDVVYGLMLFAQRRQLHKATFEYYLKEYPGNTSYYSKIAYHLKQAEEDSEAVDYYAKAGSICLNNYANKEAVTFFNEAVQLLKKLKLTNTLEYISTERKQGLKCTRI